MLRDRRLADRKRFQQLADVPFAFGGWMSWDHIRFWRLFESLGNNERS